MKKIKEYQTLLGLVIIAVTILTSSLLLTAEMNHNTGELDYELKHIKEAVRDVQKELWCQRHKNGMGC